MSARRNWPIVACLASGPSLTQEDVDLLKGRVPVIAINDAIRLAPWADVLYSSDQYWWRDVGVTTPFSGDRYSVRSSRQHVPTVFRDHPEIAVLENTGKTGLETDPSGLRTGQNSGYAAINLAVHFGATQILLLGYDMQRTGGRAHFFDHHRTSAGGSYKHFLPHFQTLVAPLAKLGIEVINCTRDTALRCFPRAPLADVLVQAAA